MAAPSPRLLALDAFRGATVALMILVNNPGDFAHTFPPLLHASWDGWTLTDLVFPFFLFIMGVALVYASSNRVGTASAAVHLHALRRSAILFGLGLALGIHRGLAHLRVMGVLQRIAIVYLVAWLITVHFQVRWQAVWAVVLCAGYGLLMLLMPVPGHGAGDLSQEGNLAAYVDTLLFSGHLYLPRWDPEGLLHSIPAVSTALAGALCAHWVRSPRSLETRTRGLVIAGVVLAAAGLGLDAVFPINKNLWSPSYVVMTAGMATALLGLCIWLVDGLGVRRWTAPFRWHGLNPLAIYVGSSAVTLIFAKVPFHTADGATWTVPRWLTTQVIQPMTAPYVASLLYALLFVGLWTAAAWLLHRKQIVIKL